MLERQFCCLFGNDGLAKCDYKVFDFRGLVLETNPGEWSYLVPDSFDVPAYLEIQMLRLTMDTVTILTVLPMSISNRSRKDDTFQYKAHPEFFNQKGTACSCK